MRYKLNSAFEKFQKRIKSDVTLLRPGYEEIATAMDGINAEKVTVDGDPEEGVINVAFLLPGDVVLSVVKTVGVNGPGEVGVNLIRDRQPIISGIENLDFLRQYIMRLESIFG